MQRRRVRHRIHALVRLVVTCAVTSLTIGTLISVQVLFDDTSSSSAYSSSSFSPLSSESTSILVADPYTVYGRRKISGHNESGQMRSMQEFSPPQLSKVSHYLKLWKKPSNQDFIPCMNPSQTYSAPGESRGYLLVHTNGGLNQMRAGISDMVAIARIINATLVIPKLDKGSYWQDLSNFSDVFDEKHFTQYLYNDIKLIKKIPKKLKRVMKANKQFRSWSGVDYYHNVISSLWKNYKIIIASKSDSRLANNNLPLDIQRLRCRVFYEALRFAPQIEALGKLLVERMRSYGPYIALHLRYEKDMLAFSGCTYGLSAREADELTKLRENTTHWKVKDIDPYEQRIKGHCPLTPKEIGIFLSLMGYPPTTPIYIAAGEIYGGDNHMADLEARFPIILNKAKLASAEELAPFTNYATQMAALDYIVAVESDVFVPSYSGNMARAVEGHRRFLGHRKTISPDRRELVRLFDKIASQNGGDEHSLQQEMNLSSNKVIEIHRKRLGSPRKRKGPISGTKGTDRFRSEEPFYENPLPDCLCYKGPITSR